MKVVIRVDFFYTEDLLNSINQNVRFYVYVWKLVIMKEVPVCVWMIIIITLKKTNKKNTCRMIFSRYD